MYASATNTLLFRLCFCFVCTATPGTTVEVMAADPATSQPGNETDSPAAQTYQLRFRFHPGDELRYHSVQTIRQHAVAPAGEKTDTSRVEQKRVYRIQDTSADGTATALMQFEHVRMEIRTDDQEPVVFDSTMAPSEVPSVFRGTADQLAGAAPRFTVRETGSLVSAEGIEENPKGGQAGFMMPLPENPVAVGESWKVHMVVGVRHAAGIMRQVTLLRSYKLKSVQDGIAEIEFATSIASQIRSPQARAQLLQATPGGTILFDLEKGQVTKREIRFDNFVLGAMGPNTSLSATGKTVEQLMVDGQATRVTAR
ncbi:MAG: DUF6263 family protein [Fuerstiella sp.]